MERTGLRRAYPLRRLILTCPALSLLVATLALAGIHDDFSNPLIDSEGYIAETIEDIAVYLTGPVIVDGTTLDPVTRIDIS